MSYSLLLILTGFQSEILFFKFINLVLKMLKFLGGKTKTKHNTSRFHCLEKIILLKIILKYNYRVKIF